MILISAIGRGARDITGETYQKTIYQFKGKESPATPFFVDAVRRHYKPEKIFLVGTRTSSWEALIEEFQESEEELWSNFLEATSGKDPKGATDKQLQQLETILSKEWNCEVRCIALAHRSIDDSNASQVLSIFIDIISSFADELTQQNEEKKLLLDLTHAFRTLPMLAFSAIQVYEAFSPGLFSRTELVYGDLKQQARQKARPAKEGPDYAQGEGVSLTSIREFAQIAHAAATFESTLDPDPLASLLEKKGFQKLARALHSFGLTLSSNSFHKMDERIRELRNVLEKIDDGQDSLPYFSLLKKRLKNLITSFEGKTLPHRLFALAHQQANHGHYAQAILALYEAASALAVPNKDLDYEAFKKEIKQYKNTLPTHKRKQFERLQKLRNSVAHGAHLIKSNDTVSEQSIKKRYDQAYHLVQELLKNS